MVMRKRGYINDDGYLVVDGILKVCPYSFNDDEAFTSCGSHCALFDAVLSSKDNTVIGAYLACCDKQWTFKTGPVKDDAK